MTTLVTGGAGFIGTALVRALVNDGEHVNVIDTGDRSPLSRVSCASSGRSVMDSYELSQAVDGVDVVYHLAAIASVQRSMTDPLEVARVNAEGTLRVVAAAARAGVRRVVLASSSAVYGRLVRPPHSESDLPMPASPYAASKLAAEVYASTVGAALGVGTTSLRLFNVYGPGQPSDGEYAAVVPAFASAALEGRAPTIYGDGTAVRDFVFIGDVVRAFRDAAASETAVGGVYNIGSGRGTSIAELWDTIADAAGAPRSVDWAPARDGEVRESIADASRAQRHFGWTPRVDLATGILATIAAARS